MILDRLLLNILLGGNTQGLQGLPIDDGTNGLLAKLGGATVSSSKFEEGLDIAVDALNDIEEASKIASAHKIAKTAKTTIKEILER